MPAIPQINQALQAAKNQMFGAVVMRHDPTGNWTVFKPDGTILATPNTTTQGLQEAWAYAWANGYALMVLGGGFTPGGGVFARVTCTTPLAIPTGWGNVAHLYGTDLYYNVAGGANAALDFITFDSCDFSEVDFHRSQITYPGNASPVRFNPATNNGESFAGFTSCKFSLPTIACVDSITLAPQATHGTGVRISVPALGLGLLYGNGIFINNDIYVGEINGGLVGFQVDNPGGSGSTFRDNVIVAPAIHANATGMNIGTSAGAAGNIFGNQWELNLGAVTTNLNFWGGEDGFRIAISGGTSGIILGTSADGPQFIESRNGSATPFTDNSTTHRFTRKTSKAPSRNVVSVGASPWVWQNPTGTTVTVLISGVSVSAIATSADGVTYDSRSSPPINSDLTMLPGTYVKITHTGAPFFIYQVQV